MPNFHLSDFSDAAKVFQHVTVRKDKPYPLWNWLRGMPWSVPLGCAFRHTLALKNGEEFDSGKDGTNLPHSGHLICNLIILLQYAKTYPEGDDRPVKWLKA